MTSTAAETEQFRPGFEAEYTTSQKREGASDEYIFLSLQRRGDGEYSTTYVNGRWHGWIAAKLEASTEPSSTSTTQAAAEGGAASAGFTTETAETRMDSGSAAGAGVGLSGNYGAAPGDALDAALAGWTFVRDGDLVFVEHPAIGRTALCRDEKKTTNMIMYHLVESLAAIAASTAQGKEK